MPSCLSATKMTKRNVVFILSDDHRFDFMGFTGKLPWLKTPHMDNMAERGVYFDQAYVTTSFVPQVVPQF